MEKLQEAMYATEGPQYTAAAEKRIPEFTTDESVNSCTVTVLPHAPAYVVGEGSKVPALAPMSSAAVGLDTVVVKKLPAPS